MPRVSVVIPSYNHAAYIKEAVQSVLSQSEKDLELIVVDDGSTDNTLDVLQKISDPRLQVIQQANQGAHVAINRGLHAATGQYLAILNSDDAYYPHRLERLIALLEADPSIGLAGSFIEIVDSQGKPLGVKHGYADCSPWPLDRPEKSLRSDEDLRAALLTENYWATTSNYFFKQETYCRLGDFAPLRYAHDWDFALRAARVGKIHLLPEPLMRYRVHSSNTIRENKAAMIFEICWCLAVHLPIQIQESWFTAKPAEHRIDQLLHSIYTYGCEQVLVAMLLYQFAENRDLALGVLESENPIRARLMQYIETQIKQQAALPMNENSSPAPPRRSLLRRVASRLCSMVLGRQPAK